MATEKKSAQNVGKVVQVIGPVIDVEFEPERLPELYNALRIDHAGNGGTPVRLTAEVEQHIGRNQVRAVAMSSTEDRKSTRLNSSHLGISYAVFCLNKKKHASDPQ